MIAAPRLALAQAYADLPTAHRKTYAIAAQHLGTTKGALSSALSRVRRSGVTVAPAIDHEAILEDWENLRDGGEYWERAAGRLGISTNAMRVVLTEARVAGDPRGCLTRFDAVYGAR